MISRSDLRVALRTLGKHRGFTAVAIASLAIAIALNTTMYSVLDAMIYPHVSVRKPENLYFLRYFGDYRKRLPAGAIEEALRAGVGHYQAITGGDWMSWGHQPLAEVGPRYMRVMPMVVRTDFFDVLGTPPLQGRTFITADEREGNAPAVISDRLARKLFPDVTPIGRAFTLDGVPYAVIGIIERSTAFDLIDGDVWVLRPQGATPVRPTIIRFSEHIPATQVESELKVIAARLALAVGEETRATRFYGHGYDVGSTFSLGAFHLALMGAVLAVLLVACANLANLQLARGLARSRELAVRSAVGASRGQLIGHLLVESAILAISGLALGTVLTLWAIHAARDLIPPVVNEVIVEPRASWRMFVVATVFALLCLFLVGLVPALRVSRVDPDTLLKSGAGTGANREHRRRYGAMVAAQIGLALPVMIASFVLIKSTLRWRDPDYLTRQMYGFDPAPVVVSNVAVPVDPKHSVLLADVDAEIQARAARVQGVTSTTIDMTRQATRTRGRKFNAVMVDYDDGSVQEIPAPLWSYHIVSPSYFRTFGQKIVRGRDFLDGENDGTGLIIDSLTAAYLWKRENPIGRAIKFGDASTTEAWRRVVGIVGDLRDTSVIRQRDPNAGFDLRGVFRVITPGDTVRSWYPGAPSAWVVMFARIRGRTELGAVRLQRELRTLVLADKPSVMPMEDEQYGVGRQRTAGDFVSLVFSTFAFVGIALVAIGMYGIVSHSIEERRREIAVRISFGAQARDILHTVLREGNVVLLIGVAIGLLLIKKSVWWLGNFIGDEEGYNALGFAAVAAVLFSIAVIAALIPALRATRIDPAEALRSE